MAKMKVGLWGIPYSKCNTLQGTKHIPTKNGILKMIFLFPRWDMLVPWRVILVVELLPRLGGASEALNRIRKAVEHRRQERIQKRRLQPVTNPEAAAISKRAKNRRRAEGC